jgi:hypothetical protein
LGACREGDLPCGPGAIPIARLGAEGEVLVGHQAVAAEPERVAELGACQGVEEGAEVVVVEEDGVAVVAAAEGVVDEAVVVGSE